MDMFALYVPKPEEFISSVIGLGFVHLFLCALAYRLKLSLIIAAIGMLAGAAIALAPDLQPLWNSNLNDYGDLAREWSSTDYSDTFFAVTSYLHVGRGRLVAVGGMIVALMLQAIVHAFVKRKRPAKNCPESPVEVNGTSKTPSGDVG